MKSIEKLIQRRSQGHRQVSVQVERKGEMVKCENGMDLAIKRPNIPLERFNRRMNQEIPSKLTLQVLVTKIKEIANW